MTLIPLFTNNFHKDPDNIVYYIGMPLLHSDMANNSIGYVFKVGSDIIDVVWDSGRFCKNSATVMYSRYVADALTANIKPITSDEVAALVASTEKTIAENQRIAEIECNHQRAARKNFEERIVKIMPDYAKAVIYAVLQCDVSDSASDYHDHKNEETILLAWSKHTRDLFPEMRKAALNHDSTKHLNDKATTVEHREKYSMGSGYYLSSSQSQHASVWVIRKQSLSYGSEPISVSNVPDGLVAIPK